MYSDVKPIKEDKRVHITDKTKGGMKSYPRTVKPTHVILHHTGGEGLKGAEDTLRQKGYGYHYMIDRNGAIYNYVDPKLATSHAGGHNNYSIGISMVGGSTKIAGAVSELQIEKAIELIKHLCQRVPSIKYVSGHRHKSNNGKWDPQWPGESGGKMNAAIDRAYMGRIGFETKLDLDIK